MKVVLAAVVLSIAACVLAVVDIPASFCSVKATGKYKGQEMLSHTNGTVTMYRVKDFVRYEFVDAAGPQSNFTLVFTPEYCHMGNFWGSHCESFSGVRLSDYTNYEKMGDFEVFSIPQSLFHFSGSLVFDSKTHELKQETLSFNGESYEISYSSVDLSFVRNDRSDGLFTLGGCTDYSGTDRSLTFISCDPPKILNPVLPGCAYVINQSCGYYENLCVHSPYTQQRVVLGDDGLLVKATMFVGSPTTILVRCDIKDDSGNCFFIFRSFSSRGDERNCTEGYAPLNANNLNDFFYGDIQKDFYFLTPFKYNGEPKNVNCPYDDAPGCKVYGKFVVISDYYRHEDYYDYILVDRDGRFLSNDGSDVGFKYTDIVPTADDFGYVFCNGTILEAPSSFTCIASLSLPSYLLVAVIASLFSLIFM